MDELHQQTVNLLSFQPLPKDVFDEQMAFNMIARYGQQSALSLETLEARVRRHYQKIAGADAPQPALMLLQPPVFHGHALAIFLEMEQAVDRERLSQALAGDHVTLAGAEDDSQPSNVNTAGQANILVSLKTRNVPAQWNLAVGCRRQPAHRGRDRGGMCRKHVRYPPAGKNPMNL